MVLICISDDDGVEYLHMYLLIVSERNSCSVTENMKEVKKTEAG